MKARNIFKVMSFDTFIPFFYPAMMFPLRRYRKQAIEMLELKAGERVLVPGVGTGHDLTLLPDDVHIEGVDISHTMLGIGEFKLRMKGKGDTVKLRIADGENLDYEDHTFDKAILSLFLTVVYDPRKALSEVARVVKPGGKILIYDHLLREGQVAPAIARPIDKVLSYSFSSVTRVFEDIVKDQPVTLVKEMPGDAVGFVHSYLLERKAEKKAVVAKKAPSDAKPKAAKRTPRKTETQP